MCKIIFQVSNEKILTNAGNNTVVQDTNKSNKEDIQPLKDPNSEVRAGIVLPHTLKNLKNINHYYFIFYQ